MGELELLRRENEVLRGALASLEQRAADAEQAVLAFARSEVDTVTVESSATPLLLRAAQGQLWRRERLLRAIFDGALDGMLLADDAGRLVDANPAACELFGMPQLELLGRTIAEFAAPNYDVAEEFARFRSSREMRGNFPLLRADGSVRSLEYTAVANVAPGLHLSVLRDITDRLVAEAKVRSSEARFRALIEKSVDGISLTGADGEIVYVSPAVSHILGFSGVDLLGRMPTEFAVEGDRWRLVKGHRRLARGERDLPLAFSARHQDGTPRYIEASLTNLLSDPDVHAVVCNFRDVTARKRAEDVLQESRSLLEEAQAIAHLGSWTSGLSPDDEIHWSAESYRIFGLPFGTRVSVRGFFELVHVADREAVLAASRAAAEHDTPYDIEHRVTRADGSLRWVHERAVVERAADGRPVRMIGTVQDITDRQVAALALRASEERYRRIVETTSEGVWTYGADGTTTFMNTRMAEMFGCTVEEAIGRPVLDFVVPEDHALALEKMQRRRAGIAETFEVDLQGRNGTFRASIQANPLQDADGQFEAAIAVVRDVSAQRALDEVRSTLAAIVESSEDAIISLTAEGVITSWNFGAQKLYQHTASEMIGSSVYHLIPNTLYDHESILLARAAAGESVLIDETERCRKDGSVIAVALSICPIRDASRAVIGISKIARDLTARRQAEETLRKTEEQFRQAQKMEAVGRLAGGIAHDFNNLLSVILSYTELALEQLRTGDPLSEDLQQIRNSGQRAAELTRHLLAFSRQQVLEPRTIDLSRILADMERMLTRLLGEDVELTVLSESDLGRVLADPGQIEQVVMNLAVNARDAMPRGGKLTIELSNTSLDDAYVSSHVGVVPGDYVVLAATDNGIGMAPATMARVFEPFFTTKEVGKGTGLGLSTVFGIAQQSGGSVSVYSEPGRGTTFKVYLPRTDRPLQPTATPASNAALDGDETILLVEDEEQVRVVGCSILRRHGYHVLGASNGGEAFLIAKQFGAKIHLLISDVVMPHMSGRALAEHITPERPDMKILFMSGYTDDAIVHHGVLAAGSAFLHKPFTPNALLRKVREALDDRRR